MINEAKRFRPKLVLIDAYKQKLSSLHEHLRAVGFFRGSFGLNTQAPLSWDVFVSDIVDGQIRRILGELAVRPQECELF